MEKYLLLRGAWNIESCCTPLEDGLNQKKQCLGFLLVYLVIQEHCMMLSIIEGWEFNPYLVLLFDKPELNVISWAKRNQGNAKVLHSHWYVRESLKQQKVMKCLPLKKDQK